MLWSDDVCPVDFINLQCWLVSEGVEDSHSTETNLYETRVTENESVPN